MKSLIRPVLAAVLLLLPLGTAQAAPLDISLYPAPDIFSGFTSINYNSTTHAFTASGFAFDLNNDGVGANETINGGTFTISATINNSGALQPGGTLTILGTVPTLGFNSGTLLTGNLTGFGFPDAGGDPLEFTFIPTGGDAQSLYAAIGGIILSQTGFPGTAFTQSFSGDGFAVADVGVVTPEPSTLAIGCLIGGVGLLARRLRRSALS